MINQVILSCNEDPTYREFWPTVAWAYKKILPEAEPHLAYLTWRDETDPLVEYYRTFGRVTLFRPETDIPEFAQAKMIRFILASEQGPDVCYIDDIDLLPLSRAFITDKVEKRPLMQLLCVGGEVYNNNGCYPISQMTGEGYLWNKFINPVNLPYRNLWDQWKGPTMFDRREDVCIKLDWSKDDYFSDERLLRRLMHNNPVTKLELSRGYDDYLESSIDRHTWDKHSDTWVYDRDKLRSGGYVNAHGIRPFGKYKKHYEPLIQYINDNY